MQEEINMVNLNKNTLCYLLSLDEGVDVFRNLVETIFPNDHFDIVCIEPRGDKFYIEIRVLGIDEITLSNKYKVFWIHEWSLLEQHLRKWIKDIRYEWRTESKFLILLRILNGLKKDLYPNCEFEIIKNNQYLVTCRLNNVIIKQEYFDIHILEKPANEVSDIDIIKCTDDVLEFLPYIQEHNELMEEVCMRIYHNPRLERTMTEQEEFHKQFIKQI